MVCLYDEEGCNYTDGQVHECIESALDGNGKAYFDDVLVVNATKSNVSEAGSRLILSA